MKILSHRPAHLTTISIKVKVCRLTHWFSFSKSSPHMHYVACMLKQSRLFVLHVRHCRLSKVSCRVVWPAPSSLLQPFNVGSGTTSCSESNDLLNSKPKTPLPVRAHFSKRGPRTCSKAPTRNLNRTEFSIQNPFRLRGSSWAINRPSPRWFAPNDSPLQ